jgi:hypothetical protein
VFISDATDSMLSQEITIQPEDTVVESRSAWEEREIAVTTTVIDNSSIVILPVINANPTPALMTTVANSYGSVLQPWETVIMPITLNPTLQWGETCYEPQQNMAITLWENTQQNQVVLYQAFMKAYGLTRFDDTDSFNGSRWLLRQEAAKILVEFGKNVLCRKQTQQYVNEYSDIDDVDSTLKPFIIEAYQYGILRWTNGVFRPRDEITKKEFVAAVMRLFINENIDVYGVANDWDREYRRLFTLLWLEKWVGNTIERYDMARIMYTLYYNGGYQWSDKWYYVPKESISKSP